MRAYIEKVNNPPVNRFVSVCGTQNGIATCPKESTSGIAYSSVSQLVK